MKILLKNYVGGEKYVNFKDIDLDIIKIILQVLKEAYQRYPLLSSSLIVSAICCSILSPLYI